MEGKCGMDFHDFPIDSQTCMFGFESCKFKSTLCFFSKTFPIISKP